MMDSFGQTLTGITQMLSNSMSDRVIDKTNGTVYRMVCTGEEDLVKLQLPLYVSMVIIPATTSGLVELQKLGDKAQLNTMFSNEWITKYYFNQVEAAALHLKEAKDRLNLPKVDSNTAGSLMSGMSSRIQFLENLLRKHGVLEEYPSNFAAKKSVIDNQGDN